MKVVVELFAGRHSHVARYAVRLGCASVRIVRGSKHTLVPPPPLQPGASVTWPLDLFEPDHVAALLDFLRQVSLRTFAHGTRRVARLLLLTAPPCKTWSSLNNLRLQRTSSTPALLAAWVLRRRNGWQCLQAARNAHDVVLGYARPGTTVHVHEQPPTARAPVGPDFNVGAPEEWPWGIRANGCTYTTCHGCALGLRVRKKLLRKSWLFQTLNSVEVPQILRHFRCTGNHKHSHATGKLATLSETYPVELASFLLADMRA